MVKGYLGWMVTPRGSEFHFRLSEDESDNFYYHNSKKAVEDYPMRGKLTDWSSNDRVIDNVAMARARRLTYNLRLKGLNVLP